MKKLLIICIFFSSCSAKSTNKIDQTHVENLAKEFMKSTVMPQMKDPKPYEITDAKVVIKKVSDRINDYRFVYDHLSLSKADSIENKRHLDSIIKVSHHPDSITSVTVDVAYKTKYRLGDIVTGSINLGYNISGHAMYATKEMSPVGHWMEITGTICKNNSADFYKTVYPYAGVSLGINDAFICCWYTKYKYNVIRPETYINRYIDQNWMPYLQTPPFPEYNSAHSTISAAADVVLSSLFKNTTFKDSSERLWGWPDRHFKNVDEAAIEVSYSRFYGGIHYRKSVFDAYEQGKKIGGLVVDKLMLNDPVLKIVSLK